MLGMKLENDIKLSDVIDLDFLQEFQDIFAKAMGVASIIVDDDGPITKPSNFSDFCMKYIRQHPQGYERCNQCDIQAGMKSFELGRPLVYKCHAGLMDFSAPIVVNGKHIASMLGGQVLSSVPDIEHFSAIFQILGSDAKQEIRQALAKIEIIPEAKISAAAELMYIVANALSRIGYQNLKLSQSSKKINLILNCMPDGVITVGYDGIISFCNTTLERMFGYSHSEIMGQRPEFLIENNQSDFAFSDIENLSHSAYETVGIKQDGSKFWVEINISEMCMGDDCSKIISIRDIDERKKLQQEVENNRTQFLAVLKNLPFMAWLKDVQGRFIAVNEQFAQNCKTPISEILGKTDMDLFPKELADSYTKWDQYIIKSKKQKVIEEQITTPEGTKWFETFKVPIIGSNGEVIGTTGYAADITERRRFDKSRNEFTSVISQELRTQLNVIRGALVVISDNLNPSLSSKTRELIDLANMNNARLINMINDIIDIEKIETRSSDYNLQTYDLRMIIEQTLDSIDFDTQFEFENFDKEILVKVDKSRLKQAFSYLFLNAEACSSADNPVKISLAENDGYVRTSVMILGYSLPDVPKESLFRKFSEIQFPEWKNKTKTGLELSLCKAIIESFDGNIDFENISDCGIVFYVDLPDVSC